MLQFFRNEDGGRLLKMPGSQRRVAPDRAEPNPGHRCWYTGGLIARSVMKPIRTLSLSIGSALFFLALAGASRAAPCGGDFNAWLADFKREAASQGVSQHAIGAALEGVTVDPAVLSRDRGQRVFTQTFEQFSGRMISSDRMRRGTALL